MKFIETCIADHVAPMALFVPPPALINKNRHDLTLAGFADLHRNGLYLGSLTNDARSDCADTNRCTSDDQVHNPRSHALQLTSPTGRLACRTQFSVCLTQEARFSERSRNPSRIHHQNVTQVLAQSKPTTHQPRQTPTKVAPHFRGLAGTLPDRWLQPSDGALQRLFRKSCNGSRTTACPKV